MTLLVLFLCGALVLGIRRPDAPDATRQRLVLVGAFVLALGYLNLRFI